METDAQFQTSRGNRTYRVVERKYAIFPSRSGRLEIPPIQFQGIARDSGDNSSQLFSGLLNQGKRLRSKSSGLTLEISPPNPSFDGKTWLPAHRIVISEGQSPPDEIVLGQPFTWQIGIQAEGLNADQLPAIQLVEDENFKLYPDKQTRNTTDDGVMVTGHVTRNLAMIANKEGEFHLPDLEIIWWNTESDTQETARLPGKRLRVTPGQDISNEHIPASDISNGSETSASRDIQPALLSNEPGSVMRYFLARLMFIVVNRLDTQFGLFQQKVKQSGLKPRKQKGFSGFFEPKLLPGTYQSLSQQRCSDGKQNAMEMEKTHLNRIISRDF